MGTGHGTEADGGLPLLAAAGGTGRSERRYFCSARRRAAATLPTRYAPIAMQTAWKARPGASSTTLVNPGAWEKTPPIMEAIQTRPRSRNR